MLPTVSEDLEHSQTGARQTKGGLGNLETAPSRILTSRAVQEGGRTSTGDGYHDRTVALVQLYSCHFVE